MKRRDDRWERLWLPRTESRALVDRDAFDPLRHRDVDARIATPGQAGSPAEFKHINKRRKRNLPGFP